MHACRTGFFSLGTVYVYDLNRYFVIGLYLCKVRYVYDLNRYFVIGLYLGQVRFEKRFLHVAASRVRNGERAARLRGGTKQRRREGVRRIGDKSLALFHNSRARCFPRVDSR